ncbi:MAG: sigma 54-interacting transcriptional regulator [Flavobacteriales bacterium]|nr:sigma 54-interacting transcriptional regulator [Flavobacteriales bacterium]
MDVLEMKELRTLGELKASGYQKRSIKEELRSNLIAGIRNKESLFNGVHGYEETVVPDVERALLAKHNIIFLGLRGQAKTRMARSLTSLLDEWMPVVKGSEIHDDPFAPISKYARDLIAEKGDDTPIEWVHRNERYIEKLATPDVTVADLIGDVDPIKAANLKLSFADERVIHYGLIPRANRSLFVINELPDLQPRIQVALFNMLQEGDIQIRGFQLRLPLDVAFIFTANPEDYTNRGSIITPLKDRIQSQIMTHYPNSIEISSTITQQEAKLTDDQREQVIVPELIKELLEMVAFEARESEWIDQKSGVSARLTITAYEHLVAAVERRMLMNDDSSGVARIGDLLSIVPAITGKVELVYEGEQEGAQFVAINLISKAIRQKFPQVFPDPEMIKRKKMNDPFGPIVSWFGQNDISILNTDSNVAYTEKLHSIDGLRSVVNHYAPGLDAETEVLFMEFLLHGLGEYNLIDKENMEQSIQFKDLFNNLFSSGLEDEE